MHPLMLAKVIERCRLRQSEGDHPSEPAFSSEVLEDAIVQLANQVLSLKIKADPDDEPSAGGPSPETKA